MQELIHEIKCKTDLLDSLKVLKYSRGLNPHDIEIYKKTENEIRILNKQLEEMKKNEGKKLVLSKIA